MKVIDDILSCILERQCCVFFVTESVLCTLEDCAIL